MNEQPIARHDDPAVAADWVDQHGDALFGFAVLRIRNRAAAEDVVQETFLAAIQARERFEGRSAERTWLISILRRKIADHFRRTARERVVGRDDVGADDGVPSSAANARMAGSWSGDPARILEDQEFWQVFHECVGKLPDKLAEAFSLRELREHSTDEICEMLGVTAANLALRVYRARTALRICLDQNWFRTHQE